MHCLHYKADEEFLMFDVTCAVRKLHKVRNGRRPLAHCQTYVVELEEQDEDFAKFWDRQLAENLATL